MNAKPVLIAAALTAAALGPAPQAPAQEAEPAKPSMIVEVEGDVLIFRAREPYQSAAVRITGRHVELDRRLEAGEGDRIRLIDQRQRPLADGRYAYEITLAPVLSEEVREVLKQSRESGDRTRVWELEREGLLPSEPRRATGVLTVVGGKVVNSREREAEPRQEAVRTAIEGRLEIAGELRVEGAKKFVARDPRDDGRTIHYAALEGPEVGVYLRGTGVTAGGVAEIELPGHFAAVADPESLTVHLTPLGGWGRLYVAEKSVRRLVIREADGADGLAFDYLVQGLRRGFEDFDPEP